MRDLILNTIRNPAVAAAMLAAGWIGIVAEFLLPGRVIPGAVGGVLALLGIWSLLPEHGGLIAAVALPLLLATAALLSFAGRIRKKKRLND